MKAFLLVPLLSLVEVLLRAATYIECSSYRGESVPLQNSSLFWLLDTRESLERARQSVSALRDSAKATVAKTSSKSKPGP